MINKILFFLFKIFSLFAFFAIMERFGINWPKSEYHLFAYIFIGIIFIINHILDKRDTPILTFNDMFGDYIKLDTKFAAITAIIISLGLAILIIVLGVYVGKNM